MVAPEYLLARIRGEYREMPDLRLTPAQGGRLWHLDAAMCRAVLSALLEEGFITQTRDGSFVASAAPGRPARIKVA